MAINLFQLLFRRELWGSTVRCVSSREKALRSLRQSSMCSRINRPPGPSRTRHLDNRSRVDRRRLTSSVALLTLSGASLKLERISYAILADLSPAKTKARMLAGSAIVSRPKSLAKGRRRSLSGAKGQRSCCGLERFLHDGQQERKQRKKRREWARRGAAAGLYCSSRSAPPGRIVDAERKRLARRLRGLLHTTAASRGPCMTRLGSSSAAMQEMSVHTRDSP